MSTTAIGMFFVCVAEVGILIRIFFTILTGGKEEDCTPLFRNKTTEMGEKIVAYNNTRGSKNNTNNVCFVIFCMSSTRAHEGGRTRDGRGCVCGGGA